MFVPSFDLRPTSRRHDVTAVGRWFVMGPISHARMHASPAWLAHLRISGWDWQNRTIDRSIDPRIEAKESDSSGISETIYSAVLLLNFFKQISRLFTFRRRYPSTLHLSWEAFLRNLYSSRYSLNKDKKDEKGSAKSFSGLLEHSGVAGGRRSGLE